VQVGGVIYQPGAVRDHPRLAVVICSDKAGNLLEVIVMLTAEGNTIAIHAMPMRPKYRRLLES
jgi:hypothetical protein